MSIWGKRRQATYLGLIVVLVIVVVAALFYFLKPTSSCFDGKQNGSEVGIDCGGNCERVCLVGVQSLRTIWTRVFSVSPGVYYVIVQAENPNNGIGMKSLPYTIRLTDDDGLLVTTRRGETFVNPREKFIIFEGGIDTGDRRVARATINFENDFEWKKVKPDKPALLVEKRSFNNDGRPRLEVSVTNDSIYTLRDVKVPVILSDKEGNAFAGSSTIIDRLAKNETKTLIFTWPVPFAEAPAGIDVYPRVNLFSLF